MMVISNAVKRNSSFSVGCTCYIINIGRDAKGAYSSYSNTKIKKEYL